MAETNLSKLKKSLKAEKRKPFSPFNIIASIMAIVVVSSVIFLVMYKPPALVPVAPMTLEQKMTHLGTGTALANQSTAPQIPRWMVAMIFSFIVIQIVPLLVAAHKARATMLTERDVREIEFLAETPLHLGLLGSLLGVCMTQFLTGSLAAPLAYFTTISGILVYLLGRFVILVSLPTSDDS